jgi:hypothetical protein
MIDKDTSHLIRRAVLKQVFVRSAALHCNLTSADVVEGCDEIACIGGAFSAFGGEHAADTGGVRVEANGRSDVQLECHAHDVGAQPGSQSRGSFHAVRRDCDGMAEHRKENVSDRHHIAPRTK